MKLSLRHGDIIILAGKQRKIVQINEMNFDEKTAAGVSPQAIARRIILDDKEEIIFLN